jgi:hypothetical protein
VSQLMHMLPTLVGDWKRIPIFLAYAHASNILRDWERFPIFLAYAHASNISKGAGNGPNFRAYAHTSNIVGDLERIPIFQNQIAKCVDCLNVIVIADNCLHGLCVFSGGFESLSSSSNAPRSLEEKNQKCTKRHLLLNS